jgi:hypothetical protein
MATAKKENEKEYALEDVTLVVGTQQNLSNLLYFITYSAHLNFKIILGQKIVFIFQQQFHKNHSLQVYSS